MGVSRDCSFLGGRIYPLLSQERVKLRTSNFVCVFTGLIGLSEQKYLRRIRRKGFNNVFNYIRASKLHLGPKFRPIELRHVGLILTVQFYKSLSFVAVDVAFATHNDTGHRQYENYRCANYYNNKIICKSN